MPTVTAFSVKPYDRSSFEAAMDGMDDAPTFSWIEARLDVETARLAHGSDIVCAFVNDDLSAPVLEVLSDGGTTAVALRCAGFNNVDLDAAATLGMRVMRVPAVLAECGRGAHPCTDPGPEPQDPPCPQPGA